MNVDSSQQLPTVLSFCSGYGGIERGLELAGLEHNVIAYVEIEAYAIANLVAKMETGLLVPAPVYTDLKTFPAEVFRGKVDLITGGYPCQSFSAAGKRKGFDSETGHIWGHIRRHIQTIRPIRCFFENVEGHIKLGLSTVISDLEEDGYRCSFGIFSAHEIGAPHQRRRIWIMGDLADRNGVRCDRGELSHGASQRSVEIEAQQRPEHPLVRSEVEGCGKDSRKNMANADSWGGKVPVKRQLTSKSMSGSQSEERGAGSPTWPPEPRLGRVVNGCANRVDRLRLLGNGVVPQTAAKAWTVLSNRRS